MNYFLIRNGTQYKIVGPCATWQEGCIQAYGVINSDYEVKNVGTNHYKITKKHFIREQMNEREGWFKPYIPNAALGLTMLASEALGPPEIAAIVGERTTAIRNAKTIEELITHWNVITEYVRFLPLHLAAKVSDIYNVKRIELQNGKITQTEQDAALTDPNFPDSDPLPGVT